MPPRARSEWKDGGKVAKRRNYVKIYYEYMPAFERLSDAQLGRLVKVMLKYGMNGTPQDFSDDVMLDVAWAVISGHIDRDMGR